MPTIDALESWCKEQKAKGKGRCHTNHVVCIEDENAKRAVNPPDERTGKPKTRIVWETNDPEVYSLFHVEKEKYMKAAGGNPVIGTEAMLVALKMHDFEAVRGFVQAIAAVKDQVKPVEGSGVPRAIIPPEVKPPREPGEDDE